MKVICCSIKRKIKQSATNHYIIKKEKLYTKKYDKKIKNVPSPGNPKKKIFSCYPIQNTKKQLFPGKINKIK